MWGTTKVWGKERRAGRTKGSLVSLSSMEEGEMAKMDTRGPREWQRARLEAEEKSLDGDGQDYVRRVRRLNSETLPGLRTRDHSALS